MTRYVDNPLGRPGVALSNLLEYGPGSAARTLLAPSTLTPDESKTVAERLGVSRGPASFIVNTFSDPIFLVAVATSFRFPVPRALRALKDGAGKAMLDEAGKPVWDNMWNVAKKLKAEEGKMLPFLSQAKSMFSNFAGTKVPDLALQSMADRIHFLDKHLVGIGDAIRKYEAGSGKVWDIRTQILTKAALEGMHKAGPRGFEKHLGPLFKSLPDDEHFTTLVSDMRGVFNNMHKDLVGSGDAKKAIAEVLNGVSRWKADRLKRWAKDMGLSVKDLERKLGLKVRDMPTGGEGVWNEIDITPDNLDEYFKPIENYAPHYPTKGLDTFAETIHQKLLPQLLEMQAGTGPMQYSTAMTNQLVRQYTRSTLKRQNRMLPAISDLELVKDHLDPEQYEKLKFMVGSNIESLAAGEGQPIREYGMRLMTDLSTYAHSAASTYAWTVRDTGGQLLEEVVRLQGADPMRAKILKDELIPTFLGKRTYEDAARGQIWSDRLQKYHTWLGSETAAKYIPEPLRKTMQSWLMDDRGRFVVDPINRGLSRYLYRGALAGNPAAAARNVFQLALTTGPAIGVKDTFKGMERVYSKSTEYFKLRFGEGLQHGEAFAKAFPEYHAAGIPRSPVIDETIGRALASAHDVGLTTSFPGVETGRAWAAKADKALMGLFSSSEQFVRLATFEGAYGKAIRDAIETGAEAGLKLTLDDVAPEALKVARRTVAETQFTSGPGASARLIQNWSSLPRQFLHFPLRMMETVTDTAWRVGSSEKTWLGGLNPGMAARMYIWSDLISEAGMEFLNTDMSQSLLPGALPLPRERGALASFPFQPPAIGLASAFVSDIAGGDLKFDETTQALPLLVPAGIAASRAVGMIPGGAEAAQAINKRYVDYTQPAPDGRYPMYTGNGNLLGYMTLGQIVLAGTGLMEKGAAIQTEQQQYKWLLANRDRIREHTSAYTKAIGNNDIAKAEEIELQFQKMLPDAGPLRRWVKPDAFETDHKRKTISRLERLLDTMPPAVRPIYAQALQQSLMGLGPELLGLEQGGLTAAPTAKGRQPYRTHPDYRSQMTPLQSQHLSPSDFSRGAPRSTAPFNSFADFEDSPF